jgi:dTDP-4-amino-4,6-dideoxygalactose transaminase
VFCDVDPATLNLDPAAVEARLGPRTRALLPVHLFGRLCQMSVFETLAGRHRLALIEDCAQALGARQGDRWAGTFGILGAFSFFPTKNLGGWGDAGALCTDDPALGERLRRLRDHGARARDDYPLIGGNFRIDTLQAAVLQVKLGVLDRALAERHAAARRYDGLFRQAGMVAPGNTLSPEYPVAVPDPGGDGAHAYNLYVVQAQRRDELQAALASQRIGTAVYYSRPLHLQPCFASLGHRSGDFPVAEAAADSVLALPLFPGIEPGQQQRVVEAVARFYRGQG